MCIRGFWLSVRRARGLQNENFLTSSWSSNVLLVNPGTVYRTLPWFDKRVCPLRLVLLRADDANVVRAATEVTKQRRKACCNASGTECKHDG